MRSTRWLSVSWLLGTALITGTIGLPAQVPETRPQFQTGVDILQLDVSVLDKNRVPVRDLTQADFRVEIDGKPAEILAFTRADLPAVTRPLAPWMRDVAPEVVVNSGDDEGRLVVVLFDRSVSFDLTVLARRIGHATIDALGPSDLAAVVYVGRAVPQNFTSDRSLLRAAVDQPFLGTDEGDGDGSGECLCGTCRLEAIETVADALRDIPRRRKELFFVGGQITFQARANWSPTRPDCWLHLKDARNKLFRALDRSNLTVHSLDPTGLSTRGNSVRLLNLGVLPERTGGRVVLSTNAPERAVASIFAETESYYVLGVERPSPRPNGRDREIDVRVNRKGLTVLSHRSYAGPPSTHGPPAPNEAGDPPMALVDALRHVLPARTIPLAMTAAPFAIPGSDRATVVVISSVARSRNETDSTGSGNRSVELLAGSWNRDGQPVVTHSQQLSVPSLSAVQPGRHSGQYELLSRLSLPRGRHEIRVAVRDPLTDETGSVYGAVDVPDFAKEELSLSGLLVGAAPAPPLASVDLVKDLPIIPTALREFTKASRVAVFVRSYQGGDDAPRDVTMIATLFGLSETPIHRETTTLAASRFGTTRSADYLIELPVAQLAPGPYLLTLEAALDATRVTRHMRFEMK